MPNKRLGQVNELIKRELSNIFLRQLELPPGLMVTISQIQTSADLSQTKVWLQILPFDQSPRVLILIQRRLFIIQRLLNQKLLTYRRPKIKFIIDATNEKADHLNELLDKLQSG